MELKGERRELDDLLYLISMAKPAGEPKEVSTSEQGTLYAQILGVDEWTSIILWWRLPSTVVQRWQADKNSFDPFEDSRWLSRITIEWRKNFIVLNFEIDAE